MPLGTLAGTEWSEADLTPDLFKACFALPVWFPAVETGEISAISPPRTM